MTPRQVRRAVERKARKQERKATNGFVFSSEDAASSQIGEQKLLSPEPPTRSPERSDGLSAAAEITISPSQLAANRLNSQLSTGPRSPEGKAKSCLNAVTTGLTGRTVLLPAEDAARYEQHIRELFAELQPVGPRETALAQAIADTLWRLARIPALEMAIFAHGRIQFADQFADRELALQPSLIEMHTFLHYEKQLRNLQIQEGRLWRQREKNTAELRQLQQDRMQKEKQDLDVAAHFYTAAKRDGKPFHPAAHGFEFSTGEIERHLERLSAARHSGDMAKRDSRPGTAVGNAA